MTKRTLLSVVKYFRRRTEENKDKFLYGEDYELVKEISKETRVNPRTLDVQIMDLADEIAYGAHDLEDALSLHLFSIDEFLYEFYQSANKESFELLETKVNNAKKIARQARVYKS